MISILKYDLYIKYKSFILNISFNQKFNFMRKNLFLLVLCLFIGINLMAQNKEVRWSDPVADPMWIFDFSNTSKTPFVPVTERPVIQSNQIQYFYSPNGVYAVNPSFRVLPRTNSHQSEVILVRHPLNQLIMFGSSNAVNFVSGVWISEGVYVTTNGGVTWFGSDTLNGAPATNHGGDPGPTIDKNGNIIMTHLGYSTSGMFGNYSTNNGLTWSANYTIQSGSVDKNFAGTDDAPTSPYYGRSYCVYTTWGSGYPPRISYTTNGGVSWSTPTDIIPAASGRVCRAEDLRVGPNGEVYVTWTPTVSSSPEDQCAFAKSTNGGVTFTGTHNAFAMSGLMVFGTGFTPYGIRMNSFPRIDVDRSGGPRNGWIYILVSQKNLAPAGTDPDIVLHRSTDGGTTWSAGIRVNQDPINNGKYQFFNAIRVDEYGGVNCVYYDNRNTAPDSAEVFVARSIDGGNTWTEYNVSGHRFKPKPISGLASGYSGDYIGISSGNNKVWPFWMDDITGVFQAWTASIDLGPAINHTPLTNTEQITGNRVVNCTVLPAGSGINPSTVKLYYAKNSTTFSNVTMTNSGGNNWTANLPLSGIGTYNYYLTATDSLARTATAPAGAPAFYYSFVASTDTVKPVITHTPIGNTPKVQWPVSISATVTDNIGVDSVWVKWYKRPPTSFAQRHVKLNFVSGNTYSSLFNSTNGEVNYNDTIFYKIFAQDNSSGHNRDSSALYSFKIINQFNACIGTGTTSSNYPYTTYWMDGRTQMLFTAAELTAAGAGPNTAIMKLGFNVITVGGPAMNGFSVKFQHTTLTSLSSWVTTGWTNAFSGTYTVPATGWQYIDLATPYFVYNGASNLLVEVCFDNSSYTSYSPVYATSVSNMCRGYYTDNSSGCTMTSGSNLTYRPNTCFTMSTSNKSNEISSVIPNTYSLNQNYPNPFNPVTRINFDIPKQGMVSLRVYDVLGREVKTLVNEVKAPGVYSVDFNGTELSSGVYFYKLESNGFTDIKKMMLIK